MSAAAERSRAARSSSPTSRWRSSTTIVAREWRFVEPASRPHHCPTTSSGWSSSRSPPSGGGGRYHAQVYCAPLRPSHTTASRSSGARHASAARDRVPGAWRKAPQLEPARRGDDGQLPPIGARRVLPRRGDANRAHARRLGRDARSSRAGPTAELPAAARSHRAAAGRARRATARSSHVSRSACTRRSGSTTRRSPSIVTSTGHPARSMTSPMR